MLWEAVPFSVAIARTKRSFKHETSFFYLPRKTALGTSHPITES